MCLEYALANRIDHGVWGGTSERERRRILRRRRSGQLTGVCDAVADLVGGQAEVLSDFPVAGFSSSCSRRAPS